MCLCHPGEMTMQKIVLTKRPVSSGSNSDVSSQDDSSDVSDLEKFDEAYADFSTLTDGVDPQTLERDGSGHPNDEVPGIDLPGGMEALFSLASVPKSWPLRGWPFHLVQPASTLRDYWKGAAWKSLWGTPIQTRNCTLLGSLLRTWWSCLLSIWLRQFLRCFGTYWIILARSSMIQRLSPCSYLFSGSTPFTERCLTQLPGIDLASLWS